MGLPHDAGDLLVDIHQLLLHPGTVLLLVLLKLQVVVDPLAGDPHQQCLADLLGTASDGQGGCLVFVHNGLHLRASGRKAGSGQGAL